MRCQVWYYAYILGSQLHHIQQIIITQYRWEWYLRQANLNRIRIITFLDLKEAYSDKKIMHALMISVNKGAVYFRIYT